jgi:hypothetical protein
MSVAEGKKAIYESEIAEILKLYTRGELDEKLHIVELSLEALASANRVSPITSEFRDSYNEFANAILRKSAGWYRTLEEAAQNYSSPKDSVNRISVPKGSFVQVKNAGTNLLVFKSFDSCRICLTEVSNSIPDNPYFGISYRTRNLDEVQSSRSLASAAGRMFLLLDTKTKQHRVYEVKKLGARYSLVPVRGYSKVQEVLYKEKPSSEEYTSTKDLSSYIGIEVELIKDTKQVVVRQRRLSAIDIGHGQGSAIGQVTPAGIKISKVLEMNLGRRGRALVEGYLQRLKSAHSYTKFEFKNTSTDTEASGYVIVAPQSYLINNDISKTEGNLLRRLEKAISKIAFNIPGSNTIIEDGIEIAINNIVSALSGKPLTKIKRHQKTTGSIDHSIKSPKAPKSKVSIQRKTKVVSDSEPVYGAQLRNLQGRFSSLTSLQRILDSRLAQQIKDNMGSGNRKDILNLRSGRFAESAKVERLSQSREGMITAFYTYMKNPYQTFEPGFKQGSPTSRNPKTLISKSIREILAEQVSNKLRAVSV